ncbi:MAG: substrate-binding domain-containing protein [Porticoccaceae bacterium]|nr:substrate-binding domain-containing protein [Porticoccaceae bacterium]
MLGHKQLQSAIISVSLLLVGSAASARETVEVVGSSTVYPFSTVVAERYGRSSGKPTPKIEATGSGGGMKLFCSGVGTNFPDITNSSRRMKKSEFDQCQRNGVEEIIEVHVGFDGIVLANSVAAQPIALTRKDIFLALAARVPGASDGQLIDNPYTTWRDVNPNLPADPIEVMGPPPTSGTRDAFVELAMEGGCQEIAWLEALKESDKLAFKIICHTIREDGLYIEAGENDNLIVQKLQANPRALGIFGFSFLDQNADTVRGARIDSVAPEFESIADKSYPISRPLYFYIKKAHVGVVPGIQGFINEFTSEKAWGDEGYLADKGMIPLPQASRRTTAKNTRGLVAMTGDEALK